MTDIQPLNLCNKMNKLTFHRLANGWKYLYNHAVVLHFQFCSVYYIPTSILVKYLVFIFTEHVTNSE